MNSKGAAPSRAAHARDVTAQHGREIRVDERRVAAEHELEQRAHAVRYRYLLEADRPSDPLGRLLMARETVTVQQHDRDAAQPRGTRRGEVRS
jgi:hypothetical protein